MPNLIWPLDKVYITQGFGMRPEYYAKYKLKGHNGLDLRSRFLDSPLGRRYVVAAADGIAFAVRADANGYGTHIRIRHTDGSVTIYGHLTRAYISQGTAVRAGERIGLTGSTGDSSGPHLHFEYRPPKWETLNNGYAGAIDPMPYIYPDH